MLHQILHRTKYNLNSVQLSLLQVVSSLLTNMAFWLKRITLFPAISKLTYLCSSEDFILLNTLVDQVRCSHRNWLNYEQYEEGIINRSLCKPFNLSYKKNPPKNLGGFCGPDGTPLLFNEPAVNTDNFKDLENGLSNSCLTRCSISGKTLINILPMIEGRKVYCIIFNKIPDCLCCGLVPDFFKITVKGGKENLVHFSRIPVSVTIT